MDLLIVRHAWAEQRDDATWPDDGLRPLTREGRKRFAKMLKRLDRGELVVDRIATSPLVRCRQTAEILADFLGKHRSRPEIVLRDELSPGGDADDLLTWTSRQAPEVQRIAWVGHAPDVDEMAALLIGAADKGICFAKGAIAALRATEDLRPGGCELRWLVTAKSLGC